VNAFNSVRYGISIAAMVDWFVALLMAFFVVSDFLKNTSLMFVSKLLSWNLISIRRITSSITSENIDLIAFTSAMSESVDVPDA